jgi:DNA polymerase-1
MNKRYPDDSERKWFKRLTFGLIYGAGATTLAENAGCDFGVAKKFIDTFYTRYPAVRDWNEMMSRTADTFGRHGSKDAGYDVTRNWVHVSETGRRYVFNEYKSTWGDREYTFSPTELKNYPVQGLATGDIVPMMLGILYRKLINKPHVYLVNTVHDSIMLDVHDDVLDETVKEVRSTLNNTHVYYQQTFGIPLALKLTAGAQVGLNWFSTEKV